MTTKLMEIVEFFKKVIFLLESIDEKAAGFLGTESPDDPLAMEDFDVDKLFTRMMVVGKLGISQRTYTRWVDKRILIPIEVGNKHFYREEGLKEAMRRSINKGRI